MTIVLDASVAVAALLDTERNSEWPNYLAEHHEPAGPELLMVETNDILRRFELAGRISASL